MDETISPAVTDMLNRGILSTVTETNLDALLDSKTLVVLFFTGGPKRVRESHDIAVALREVLKDYMGMVDTAVFDVEQETQHYARFRVITAPCLVFISGGKTLEVIPGVRDWSDYVQAFQRYLGRPLREANA
ncbi:MAG: hypothetical protein AAGI24_06205 [Pseudomonadota bacterium]